MQRNISVRISLYTCGYVPPYYCRSDTYFFLKHYLYFLCCKVSNYLHYAKLFAEYFSNYPDYFLYSSKYMDKYKYKRIIFSLINLFDAT